MTENGSTSKRNGGALSHATIMHALGTLEAKVEHAAQSRAVMHKKLDAQAVLQNETVKTLADTNFALKVTTDIAVQARDGVTKLAAELSALKPVIDGHTTFTLDAEPLLKTMRMIRTALIAVAALLTLGGVSVGVLAMNANWVIKTALRAYLDLPTP